MVYICGGCWEGQRNGALALLRQYLRFLSLQCNSILWFPRVVFSQGGGDTSGECSCRSRGVCSWTDSKNQGMQSCR